MKPYWKTEDPAQTTGACVVALLNRHGFPTVNTEERAQFADWWNGLPVRITAFCYTGSLGALELCPPVHYSDLSSSHQALTGLCEKGSGEPCLFAAFSSSLCLPHSTIWFTCRTAASMSASWAAASMPWASSCCTT